MHFRTHATKLRIDWKVLTVLLLCLILISAYLRVFGPIRRQKSLSGISDALVLHAFMYEFPIAGEFGLFVVDLDSERLTRWVSLDQAAGAPMMYPQHRSLLFGVYTHADFEPFTLSLDGEVDEAENVQLTNMQFSKPNRVRGHTLSSDGSKVAFIYQDEIYIQHVDGSSLRQLTNDGLRKSSVSWSPSGQELAFSSRDRVDKSNIYVMSQDGSNLVNLTTELAGNSVRTKWSPDGSQIAFINIIPEQPIALWLMNPDGSDAAPIFSATNGGEVRGSISAYAWSPDSRRIALVSSHEGYCGVLVATVSTTSCTESVYLINRDGTGLTKVTHRWLEGTSLLWISSG